MYKIKIINKKYSIKIIVYFQDFYNPAEFKIIDEYELFSYQESISFLKKLIRKGILNFDDLKKIIVMTIHKKFFHRAHSKKKKYASIVIKKKRNIFNLPEVSIINKRNNKVLADNITSETEFINYLGELITKGILNPNELMNSNRRITYLKGLQLINNTVILQN